jgi:putative phage-type endonuclease
MTRALVPGSPEWHADRRGGIGASDAPIITGDAPWGDLLTLYAAKSGIIDEPDVANEQTNWGKKLEATVAEWWVEKQAKQGRTVRVRRDNTRPRHPKYDWLRTSLDFRVIGENALLETKTRRFPTDEWGPAGTAEIPAHYVVQVQHEMAATGAAVCYVAVLFAGSEPRDYEVPRDEALIADLIELEAEFMECIRTGTPPEQLIRKQRPVIPFREGEITADETLAMGIEGVYHARQEIKGLQADEKKAADAVKTLLGPNTAARAGAYRATFKQNADSTPIRWELVAAAYRKTIVERRIQVIEREGVPILDDERAAIVAELDGIVALFTDLKPGDRPLRISRKEEAEAA